MYQISICDDDEIFCKDLKKQLTLILNEFSIDFKLYIFHTPEPLLTVIQNELDKFHLIILDIILDKGNGIDIGKKIRNLGVQASILFLTSTKDYSYEGYSVYPIHYLLKPVEKEKLMEILKKDYFGRFQPKHILLPCQGQNKVIEINSIWYIETLNRKIIIHTQTEQIQYTDTLQDILNQLPEKQFIRCHKSFIINMSKLITFSRSGFTLKDNTVIPAGRAFYNAAVSDFIAYLEDDL